MKKPRHAAAPAARTDVARRLQIKAGFSLTMPAVARLANNLDTPQAMLKPKTLNAKALRPAAPACGAWPC
jgi:hypothetical protein